MSPPGTMARVYQALKARVMAGAFAPGERIDPNRLSGELAASATPIREALHRLAGERLVESWTQEGFRQPIITEASLRDLYAWSEDLLRLLIRTAERTSAEPVGPPALPPDDFASAAAAAFEWIAGLSLNEEHRAAVTSLNERSHAVRTVEGRVIEQARSELTELVDTIVGCRWTEARRLAAHYHASRHRRLAEIAGHFRRREG